MIFSIKLLGSFLKSTLFLSTTRQTD